MNFVTRTTTSTRPVKNAPKVLMARERTMWRRLAWSFSVRRWRFQCRTMPVWLSVNETNTPTMYSWISRVESAP